MTDVAQPAVDGALPSELEAHRRELTGYCYRMLGSAAEAEDAAQDTLVRAWRAHDRFEGRSSLRTWLYRIATNTCIDMTRSTQRRARPMEIGPSSTVGQAVLTEQPGSVWVGPAPDARILAGDDPAVVAELRDTVRLALVAALQHLPPRQRAALIGCEVLGWSAAETAEVLESTVASVNSALQRARATLASMDVEVRTDAATLDADHRALLQAYVDAFEAYDLDALSALLAHDVVMNMPPFDLWLEGPEEVMAWLRGPGAECRGSRLVAVEANGRTAFAQYRLHPDGSHRPWSLTTLELRDGRITEWTSFLDADDLFPRFGLPATLG